MILLLLGIENIRPTEAGSGMVVAKDWEDEKVSVTQNEEIPGVPHTMVAIVSNTLLHT